MVRQLPDHRRPDFFSHSPTEVQASLGPPVQAVAPVTLEENDEEDADPSSSCNSCPLLSGSFPDFAHDLSKRQPKACGQPQESQWSGR